MEMVEDVHNKGKLVQHSCTSLGLVLAATRHTSYCQGPLLHYTRLGRRQRRQHWIHRTSAKISVNFKNRQCRYPLLWWTVIKTNGVLLCKPGRLETKPLQGVSGWCHTGWPLCPYSNCAHSSRTLVKRSFTWKKGRISISQRENR